MQLLKRALTIWLTKAVLASLVSRIDGVPAREVERSYEQYRVVRAIANTEEQQEVLERAVRASEEEETGCEFLKEAHRLGLPSDFMCHSAEIADRVAERMRRAGGDAHVLMESLGRRIQESEDERNPDLLSRMTRDVRSMNWNNYQRYDTIVAWLDQLAADNPSVITLTELGRSHENRRIIMAKIGRSPRGEDTRAVWIDGGIHAREWIAPATATYMLGKLVETFANNDTSTCEARAIQAVDWYVAPLLNPDGYEYSHTNDRMWRKNRAPPPSGSSCYGVDLNRNWDTIGFGLGATSTNPCRETYRGSEASSEPETKAVATALLAIKDKVRIYLSFHSYGQYWLTSWGYKTSLPLDNDKLVRLGRQAVEAIQCVTPNRRYTIGSAGAIFYIAGGASDDYAKATAHIPYSFTVELPDTGSNGFLLPANQISTVGRELWAATSVLAKEAARHNMGPDPALAADPSSYSDQ